MSITSLISDDEMAQIKKQVLKAIFDDQHGSGSIPHLFFPDIHLVSEQSEIYLVDDTIKKPMRIEKLNKNIMAVTDNTLETLANERGKIIYLQFRTENIKKDFLTLNLEAKIFSPSLDHRKINLSNMQMNFQKHNNIWKIVDQPIYLSS